MSKRVSSNRSRAGRALTGAPIRPRKAVFAGPFESFTAHADSRSCAALRMATRVRLDKGVAGGRTVQTPVGLAFKARARARPSTRSTSQRRLTWRAFARVPGRPSRTRRTRHALNPVVSHDEPVAQTTGSGASYSSDHRSRRRPGAHLDAAVVDRAPEVVESRCGGNGNGACSEAPFSYRTLHAAGDEAAGRRAPRTTLLRRHAPDLYRHQRPGLGGDRSGARDHLAEHVDGLRH